MTISRLVFSDYSVKQSRWVAVGIVLGLACSSYFVQSRRDLQQTDDLGLDNPGSESLVEINSFAQALQNFFLPHVTTDPGSLDQSLLNAQEKPADGLKHKWHKGAKVKVNGRGEKNAVGLIGTVDTAEVVQVFLDEDKKKAEHDNEKAAKKIKEVDIIDKLPLHRYHEGDITWKFPVSSDREFLIGDEVRITKEGATHNKVAFIVALHMVKVTLCKEFTYQDTGETSKILMTDPDYLVAATADDTCPGSSSASSFAQSLDFFRPLTKMLGY